MSELQPVACSLAPEEEEQRGREVGDLARRALLARTREGGAVVLTYRAEDDVEAAVRDLVRRERDCCPFLEFELARGGDELLLRIFAPEEAEKMLDLIYEASAP